jgi:hypothetical protein
MQPLDARTRKLLLSFFLLLVLSIFNFDAQSEPLDVLKAPKGLIDTSPLGLWTLTLTNAAR